MDNNRLITMIIGGLACLIIGILIGRTGSGAPTPLSAPPPSVGEQTAGEGAALARRDADAPRAMDEPTGFAFLAYRINTSGDAPRACFVFSRELDSERDYRPFVEVDADRPVTVSAAGNSVCVDGLGFAENARVTLLEGLPARDGETLARSEEVTVSFEDRPAVVAFEGDGIILPRRDADGLAIQTVNVDKVRVSILRVNDRALVQKSLTSGDTTGEGQYAYTWGEDAASDVGVRVWSGSMDVDNQPNLAVTTVFPLAEALGSLQSGAYYIEVTDASIEDASEPQASARRWIVFTDYALTAYRGQSGLDVVLRGLQSALPVKDGRVQLIAQNNEVLGEATTNAFGQVRFDGPLLQGSGPLAPRMVMAFGDEGDFAVLDLTRQPLDLSGMPVDGRPEGGPVDGYAYLDRGIYRPGETLHLTALIRDAAGMAVSDRPATLRLRKPNGLLAAERRYTPGELSPLGSLRWDYALPRASARGRWVAELEVDGVGQVASTDFQVEDFVPQRIAVEIDADATTPVLSGQSRTLVSTTRFLYGAPGAGLNATADARVTLDPSPFAGYEDFSFGFTADRFAEQILELDTTVTDGAGVARFNLRPDGQFADETRPLRLQAVVRVEEPGGRAVAESVRIPYRPRDLYIGIDPQFDGSVRSGTAAQFDVIALNAEGASQPVEASWQLIEVSYDYDWYQDNGGAWRWRRTKSVDVVDEGRVDLRAEPRTLTLNEFDRGWGQYVLKVTAGEDAAAEMEFFVGWGRSGEDGVEAPDRLEVVGPDAPTAPGESAEIVINAPYAGQAQVVVATHRVLSVNHVELRDGRARVSLPVTDGWGEGAYVLVSAFTPRDAVAQPRPRRAVGLTYVPVNLGKRRFELALEAPEVARPETTVDIGINAVDAPGREDIYLTLAAVDEGILRLTKFESPDPVEHFFGRKALAIDLYDDYGRLLDPNQGAAAAIREGGDQLGGEGLTVVPTKSVVLFEGPVAFDDRGRARVEFDLPAFDGELRLMAVAWSRSGLAAADQSMTVRAPVAANLILPRFLAPGDEATATLSLDNVEGGVGDYSAALNAGGPLSSGVPTLSAALTRGQRADLAVPLTASEPGVADLGFALSGPDRFELARDYQIEVRAPFTDVLSVSRDRLAPGETYALNDAALSNYVTGASEVTVSFSALPFDASALFKSLSRYPYGCTEQIVSRAFPLLFAEELSALSGEGPQRDRSASIVQDVIETLLNRQSSNGAIGLWREGDRAANPWIAAYAIDFLSRAREAGFVVPEEALNRALETLQPVARENRYQAFYYEYEPFGGGEVTQRRLVKNSAAYAHYVLARHQRTALDRVRYMFIRDRNNLESPLALAHLGAALDALGDRSRAVVAYDLAEEKLGHNDRYDYYQTPLRDLSGVVSVLARAGADGERITRLGDRLADQRVEVSRLTTQEKAQLVLAIDALTGGEAQVAVSSSSGELASVMGTASVTGGAAALQGVSFTNDGDVPLWRTTLIRGATVSPPAPAAEDLQAVKQIRTLRGQSPDLTDLRQGDRLIVSLTLSPRQNRVNPLIIADLLPAGFEIETVLGPADGAPAYDEGPRGAYGWLGVLAEADIAEARDDRFVAAIDVERDPVTLAYVVRAVTPGAFVLPGVQAEDMYRPDVFARTAAGSVTIGAAAN